MELVIATNNRHKFEEIFSLLGDIPFELLPLSAYPNPPNLPEEGDTYQENALSKARRVSQFTKCWALGDDTGLEVDALDGAPGLYSARYAGEGVSFRENREKLLKALEGVSKPDRSALFRCVIALVGPSGEEKVVEGVVSGMITEEDQGTEGFGYDAIFFLPELGKTFSELDAREKNRVSHRAKAVEKIEEHLRRIEDPG